MNKERTVQEDEELRKICEDYLRFGEMGDEGIQLRELQNIINILRLYEVGWRLSEAQALVDNLDTKSKIKDWNKENKSITQLLRSDNLKSVVDKEIEKLNKIDCDYSKYYIFSQYKDKSGKIVPTYILTKKGFIKTLIECSELAKCYYLNLLEKFGDEEQRVVIYREFLTPRREELVFKQELNQLMKQLEIEVECQKRVGNQYKIDFYLPKFNLAIEYDEKYHINQIQKEKDLTRENSIKEILKCDFIRVSSSKSNIENLGEIIKELRHRGWD